MNIFTKTTRIMFDQILGMGRGFPGGSAIKNPPVNWET